MKILIISNYANGLILFRKEVLESFVKCGYEVIVSVPEDENCKKLNPLGVRIVPSRLERRGMNPVKDLKLLMDYMKLIKAEKPDIALTYTIKPNLYGSLACAIKKIPYLINITGLGTALENPGLLGKALLLFYKIVTKRAACVFFQNAGNQKFMQDRGIAVKNSRLLPGSGVNLEEHPFVKYPSEEDGIRILAVLRIMKDKGIEEYIEAAKAIHQKYPEVSFELVGEYEEETREKYEPIITELEKQGTLKYYGHIDNVPEVMAQSHIIVHPSYHEGLSNVCLEAAACGRPVLTTDVPGCRETVIAAQNSDGSPIGILFPAQSSDDSPSGILLPVQSSDDSPSGILFPTKSSEALILAIESILKLTFKQREEMGIAARKHVEKNFSRQIVIDAYHDVIEKII